MGLSQILHSKCKDKSAKRTGSSQFQHMEFLQDNWHGLDTPSNPVCTKKITLGTQRLTLVFLGSLGGVSCP